MGMITHPHITTDDDGFSAQQASDDTFNQKFRQGACRQRQASKRPKAQIVHLLTSRHSWFAHSARYIERAAQMLRIQFMKVGLHQKKARRRHESWAAPEEGHQKKARMAIGSPHFEKVLMTIIFVCQMVNPLFRRKHVGSQRCTTFFRKCGCRLQSSLMVTCWRLLPIRWMTPLASSFGANSQTLMWRLPESSALSRVWAPSKDGSAHK